MNMLSKFIQKVVRPKLCNRAYIDNSIQAISCAAIQGRRDRNANESNRAMDRLIYLSLEDYEYAAQKITLALITVADATTNKEDELQTKLHYELKAIDAGDGVDAMVLSYYDESICSTEYLTFQLVETQIFEPSLNGMLDAVGV